MAIERMACAPTSLNIAMLSPPLIAALDCRKNMSDEPTSVIEVAVRLGKQKTYFQNIEVARY